LTRAEQSFPLLMAGSLAVHVAVMALLVFGGGGSGPHQSRVQVYSVQIVEAPAPPSARVLNLEPPVNRPEALVIPPGAPPAPPAVSAPGLPKSQPRAPSLPVPVLPTQGDIQVAVPNSPPALPAAPGTSAPALPALPGESPGPKPEPAARVRPRVPEPVSPDTSAQEAPAPASPLSQLRKKIEHLKVQIDTPVPGPSDSAEPDQDSGKGLRLFRNALRERVQKNYSFPGNFSRSLKATVRVVIARDGTLLSADIIQSSGDDRFDNLVCLPAIRNSKFPPVPDSIQGDSYTWTYTFSP
jgi:TonB family protein